MKRLMAMPARAAAVAAIVFSVFTFTAVALPRFALTSGQPCSSCHVMSSGGGMRNEGGWVTMKRTGLWKLLEAPESNRLFTESIRWGFDIRNQTAYRYIVEKREYERRPFFMQIMPYVNYKPIEEIDIHAGVNIVEPIWPSQQRVTAALVAKPMEQIAIEAGYFQPDIGLKHDDHTTLTRSALRLYPGWNEFGANVSATPLEWLTLGVGVFDAHNRRKELFETGAGDVISNGDAILTGKINTLYADYDLGVSGFAGASYFTAGGQRIFGIHSGVGLIESVSLYAEYLEMKNSAPGASFDPQDRIFSIGSSYELMEAVAITARYEEAHHESAPGVTQLIKQYVIGAQIFVIPSVELRPEYRWRDTPTVRVAQWGGQVHLFF